MKTIPTRRFSNVMFVLGIIFTIISIIYLCVSLVESLTYTGGIDYAALAFLNLFVSNVIMVVGHKKVVDPDYLIIFLRDFMENKGER